MEDEKIIGLFFERSETAIHELEQKYGGLCLHIAKNILGRQQDAEECVNDTYLGVWGAIPPERPKNLRAFVSRIARNLALKKYEREQAEKRQSNFGISIEELKGTLSDTLSVEENTDTELLRQTINDFLSELDKLNRVLFVRRYWMSDSYEKLSEITGLNRNAVRTRLSRTRKKLKEYLVEKEVVV